MTAPRAATRPLSNLVYLVDRESRIDHPGAPLMLVLHDRAERSTRSIEFTSPLRETARIVAVEASKGVWHGKQVVGYTWYMGDLDRPAPLAFGGSLEELEAFLLDTLDRRAEGDATLPYLLGIGQGGTMALGLAAVQPDRLSGVIAIDALFPDVPGWDPPLAPLDGLPVLVLDTGREVAPRTPAPRGPAIASIFAGWGAQARFLSGAAGDPLHASIAAWLTMFPPRRGGSR